MNIFLLEHKESVSHHFGMIIAILSLMLIVIIVGLEMYVRWTISKEFRFLGGFELEALTISAFAFALGVLYLNRAK